MAGGVPGAERGEWTRLRPDELDGLPATRLEVHYAVQLLPSFGQALVPGRSDDSHRSMHWDPDLPGLRSEPSGVDGLYGGLTLPDFTLEVRRAGDALAGFALAGVRPGDARDRLAEVLRDALGQDVELTWPEYDLPPRDGGWERALDPEHAALRTLAAWFRNAALVLEHLTEGDAQASPVRCWPHHFDIASLLTLPGKVGEDPSHVGLGLSPGDAPGDLPYLYVNGWPAPEPERLPPLPPPARWNTEGWVGAVLAAGDLAIPADAGEQRERAEGFFRAARAAMQAVLARHGHGEGDEELSD